MMMLMLCLAVAEQERLDEFLGKFNETHRPFQARLEVRKTGKLDEDSPRFSATVTLSPDGALRVEWTAGRPSGEEAEILFDLWRHGFDAALREQFDIRLDRDPEGDALPAAITGADGKSVEVDVAKGALRKRPGRVVAAQAVDLADACYVVTLVPKKREPKGALESVRVYVDKTSFRILRMVIEEEGKRLECIVTGFSESDP